MRARELTLDLARLAFATLGVVAITYMFGYLNTSPDVHFRPANYFSFFTIQTNVFAIAMLALTAVVRRDERSALFDGVRGAVSFSITITGVVFALLLAGHQEQLDTHVGWVDFTVHKLIPLVVVLDWLVEPARHRLPRWTAAAWLAYPLLWFAYTLARGPSANWYPYPFVDVASHGYGRVLLNGVVFAICFVVGAAAFLSLGNWRARSKTQAASGESASAHA